MALAVLTLSRTATGFQFQSIGAVSPLLVEHLHIGNTELGLLVGLFSLPGVVLALPGGLLGVRFGDHRIVLTGLGLMAIGSLGIGLADSLAIAVAGRSLSAVGNILLNVVMTKMIADWFAGREIIFAMTVLINAWPVGIATAMFTLPAVAMRWSLVAAFDVAALVAIAGAAAVAVLYRPAAAVEGAAGRIGLATLSRRETGLVVLAAVPWTLYNAGYAVMLGFVPALLVRDRFSVEQAGLLLGVNTLLVILSVLLGGALAQWLTKPRVLVATGLLGFTVTLALLPYGSPVLMLIVGGLVGGLPAGALIAAPASVLRPQSRGPGMGLFYTVYYAGTAVLPPVSGWLQDVFRGAAAVESAAVMVVLTLACSLVFDHVRRARPA
jgi:MFS family permease